MVLYFPVCQLSYGCVLSLKAEVDIKSASMIKHTNFQFVHVNLFPRVVLALILGLNNYHLVVMCRADVADTVEV